MLHDSDRGADDHFDVLRDERDAAAGEFADPQHRREHHLLGYGRRAG